MKRATFKAKNPHRHGYPCWGDRDGEIVTIIYAPGENPAQPKLRLYQAKFDDGTPLTAFPHEIVDIHDATPTIYAGTLAQLAGILAAAKSIEIRCENQDGSTSICIINPATLAITPTLSNSDTL